MADDKGWCCRWLTGVSLASLISGWWCHWFDFSITPLSGSPKWPWQKNKHNSILVSVAVIKAPVLCLCLWQAACVEVGMACWAEAIKAYSHACSFQEFQENESRSWFLLAWWNRASWEAVSAQRAAFLGRERRRKMVLQTIRLCNEFIFLRGREVVSVVSSRDIDYALCSQSACGTPAEALRGWSQPVSGLGGEKSSDEVVSIQLYKCLSSYSCFCVDLDSGADGWQEGTGSRRRSCKKQSGFSVNPTKEGGRIFGQAVVVWEPVPGTLQQTLG